MIYICHRFSNIIKKQNKKQVFSLKKNQKNNRQTQMNIHLFLYFSFWTDARDLTSICVKDPLVTCCFLSFVQVVVSFIHSLFSFSILLHLAVLSYNGSKYKFGMIYHQNKSFGNICRNRFKIEKSNSSNAYPPPPKKNNPEKLLYFV